MRARTASRNNKATEIPAWMWAASGLPAPLPEFRFCKDRKFRADYAFTISKVLVEIEGGAWTRGRHTRGAGYLSDCEKYNIAQELGYVVLRYAPNAVDFNQIKRVISSRNQPA